MGYYEGFVVPVPASRKEEYRRHAEGAVPLFHEFGVERMVEAWADDVPDGKVTDFKGAVQAKDDEVVVFSWFEYPSKQARDAANAKMTSDPRMMEMGAEMPFDGKRMIMGGFETLVEQSSDRPTAYTDGYLLAVPDEKKEAYRALAEKAASIFLEHGASRVVETWQDDVPDGKVTDFRRAVKAKEGESVVFSFSEWPSKEARQQGWEKIMADERMKPEAENMPFDGQRMIYGGFEMLVDQRS
jgi:uncharacterized protein YbaA (DUF1428 family)